MNFGFPYHRFLRPARGEQFVHMKTSTLVVNSYFLGICSEPGPLSSIKGIFIVPHLLQHGDLVFVLSSERPSYLVGFADK